MCRLTMFKVMAHLVAMGLVSASARSAEQKFDAEAVVSKYEESLKLFNHVQYTATLRTYVATGEQGTEKPNLDMQYVVRRNGDLWRLRMEGTVRNLTNDAARPSPRNFEFLHNSSGDMTEVHWERDGSAPMVAVDRKAPQSRRRGAVFGLGEFTLIHGYLNIRELPYLPDVLRASRLSARRDSLNDYEVILLSGMGRNGQVKAWFDPSAEYCLRKLEWRLGPKDFLGNKSLDDLGFTETTVIVDDCDFTRVDNHWVLSRFTRRTSSTRKDRATTSRAVCEFKDISLAPRELRDASVFELKNEVPDGTRVQVDDQPQINYGWQGGQIVKDAGVDPRGLKGQRFMPGRVPTTLIVVCAAAAVMIVALLIVRRSRRRKETSE